MRILFCGSGEFAVHTLRAVCNTEHELIGILTQPARPAGRGGKLRPTPVAQAAAEMGLTATECPNINVPEMVERISQLQPDVICVVDFGQMVRKPVRDCARLDTINLHGSILPELRGAAPVNWAIIRGHETTGVTTFSLVDKMDAGPMIAKAETPISPDETADELKARLAEIGGDLMCETLGVLAGGWAGYEEQDHGKATLAPRMSKADGRIHWDADATTIRNLIHGTWPWPGGQTVFVRQCGKESPVVIARAQVAEGTAQAAPGVIDQDLCVSTGSGRLRILEIKPAGKRMMAFRDFVNGYRVTPGDHFVEYQPE